MNDDEFSIKALYEAFAIQKAAFLRNQYPSLGERQANLLKLSNMMLDNRQQIRDALTADFGVHPNGLADVIECIGPAARAEWTATQLEDWMQDSVREVDIAVYPGATAKVRYEPKGVVGCLSPFNFPLDLSFGPLCEQLAAGNRVIIKPSELTPACSALIKEMVNSTFSAEYVEVVLGGIDLATEFSRLKWDHLMYTGSPGVAKLVMAAAAANLTPLTLELGGKCPAFILEDGLSDRAIETILGIKQMKSGQMCVTVDTVHLPRSQLDRFIELCLAQSQKLGLNYSSSDNCTGICTKRHYDRLVALLAEATKSEARVINLNGSAKPNPLTRQIPTSLIINPAETLGIAQQEIFGPLMVVRTYDDLDEAIDYVNSQERPLAVYAFTDNDGFADHIIYNTNSGGACQNAAAVHGAIPTLPFGGVGHSGFGRCRAFEGFKEFSNPKGIFRRGKPKDGLPALFAPYSTAVGLADKLLDARSTKPVSVG